MAQFNCIIIDPDMQARMRLKQAASPLPEFGHVGLVGNFHEANQHIDGEKQLDVVFISARIPSEEIQQFISRAKGSKQGQFSAFVVVLRNSGDGSSQIAQTMMIGGDGVLCEPYSVDALLEITLLASKVRKERSDARERVAFTLLAKDITNQIDLIACLKANDCEPGLSLRKLRELSSKLANLSDETRAIYYEVMETAFMDAPLPPKALAVKKYGGASSRVKKKMGDKIASELQKTQGS